MPFSELVQLLLYVIPGFIGLKIFYVFGLRQRRTDLEWTIWSIALSTLAFIVAAPARMWLGLSESDALAVALSYPAALLLAGLLVAIWRSPAIRREHWRLIAEPWDMAYLAAIDRHLQAVIELHDGREVYGDILWMGLAGEGSARSITVGSAQMSDGGERWTMLPLDHELHIPESSIRVLRLVPFVEAVDASEGDGHGAGATDVMRKVSVSTVERSILGSPGAVCAERHVRP